jgi:uncharacterized coiled-coil DUF342 family protein
VRTISEAIKLSEWIDKLCGIMIKMSKWNHEKHELYKQLDEEKKNVNFLNQQIINLQRKIDIENEKRYMVWNEIENCIERIMKGDYKPQKEGRTYKLL